MNYGLRDKSEIAKFSKLVVSVFGGGYATERALMEIAAVETQYGDFPDAHPDRLGVGITQFDQIGFDDVVQRTRPRHKKRMLDMLGYDLDTLQLADLAYDPLLALAMTRLKYLLIPEVIPDTVEGRARYWKKYYNTELGKGTVQHYLDSVKLHLRS